MAKAYESYAQQFEISNCMNQMEQMFIDAIEQNKRQINCFNILKNIK